MKLFKKTIILQLLKLVKNVPPINKYNKISYEKGIIYAFNCFCGLVCGRYECANLS